MILFNQSNKPFHGTRVDSVAQIMPKKLFRSKRSRVVLGYFGPADGQRPRAQNLKNGGAKMHPIFGPKSSILCLGSEAHGARLPKTFGVGSLGRFCFLVRKFRGDVGV
jgi:hypothetical protein